MIFKCYGTGFSSFFVGLLLRIGLMLCAIQGPAFARHGFVLNFWQDGISEEMLLEQVDRAARLGASHFSIPALLCQDSKTSVDINWCSSSGPSSPTRLSSLGRMVTSRGLTLSYLPLVLGRDGSWRGQFKPSNFDTWGRSYAGRMRELAAIARDAGAQEFIAGSEFNDLYLQPDYWRGLLTELRAIIPGAAVFVVSNWDQIERVPFWDACDYIAFSGYFPLVNGIASNPTLANLADGWRPWKTKLLELSRAHGKQLYFAELGYAAVDTAASAPWDYGGTAPLNLPLQANLYQAFALAWQGQPELRRVMIWSLSPSPSPLQDKGFDIFGKPAEGVVSSFFLDQTSGQSCRFAMEK